MPGIMNPLRASCGEHQQNIESVARTQLKQSSYYALRRVSCEFDGQVLKLRGRVFSYYEKQVAQSLVMPYLDGTIPIENHLEVVAGAPTQ